MLPLTSALPDWSSWPREGGDVPAVSCVMRAFVFSWRLLTASRESPQSRKLLPPHVIWRPRCKWGEKKIKTAGKIDQCGETPRDDAFPFRG
jgi:hypothetical protein